MATRRVKCQDTGEYSTSDIAYRSDNGKYWSSEAAYIWWKKNKEWKQKCIDLLFEILDYQQGMTVPGILWKNFSKYEKMGYEVVYETICGERKSIEWALHNKEFKSEASMIVYVCRILENHMMDYYKAYKSLQKEQEKNEAMVIPDAIDVQNKKQGAKDISRFLED